MSRRSRFKNWKATNITEMKACLGLLLHVGVVNLPNLQDCWSRDPFLQTNVIWKHGLSRDRFLLLLCFWDFKDETNPESRLQKISPLIDHLNNTMSKVYCPDENLSLKNKRHKYGVKLYELWLRANWCNSNESANRLCWRRIHCLCWQLLQLRPT